MPRDPASTPPEMMSFSTGLPPRVPARPPAKRGPKNKTKKNKAQVSRELTLAPHANSTERMQSKIYNLTLDVNELKRQVQALQMYHSILYARALVSQYDDDGSILKKVHNYFGLFRRGYDTTDRRPAALIRSITDEDLSLGVTGFGRDMLLEQWRRYTDYFGMRRCEVPSPRLLPGADEDETETRTVRAELSFTGSFTPTALALVFPAVLHDPELTQELLGKDLEATAIFHLHFNKAGMLVRHDVETDFFAVLAKALGDPVRAAEIMQVAAVAEESMLADPEEDAHVPLEPVERVAQSKRSRVHVVSEESEEEEEDLRARQEPDAEPIGTRHSVEYLLS